MASFANSVPINASDETDGTAKPGISHLGDHMSVFFPADKGGLEIDKRAPSIYSFGLGKRTSASGPGMYNFGLGKRPVRYFWKLLGMYCMGTSWHKGSHFLNRMEDLAEYFKRNPGNAGQRFSFGLGKRSSGSEEESDQEEGILTPEDLSDALIISDNDGGMDRTEKRSFPAASDSAGLKVFFPVQPYRSYYPQISLRRRLISAGKTFPTFDKRPMPAYNFGLGK